MLIDLGCPFDQRALSAAIQSGNAQIVSFLLAPSSISPPMSSYLTPDFLRSFIAKCDLITTDLIEAIFDDLDLEFTEDMFLEVTRTAKVNVMRWALEREKEAQEEEEEVVVEEEENEDKRNESLATEEAMFTALTSMRCGYSDLLEMLKLLLDINDSTPPLSSPKSEKQKKKEKELISDRCLDVIVNGSFPHLLGFLFDHSIEKERVHNTIVSNLETVKNVFTLSCGSFSVWLRENGFLPLDQKFAVSVPRGGFSVSSFDDSEYSPFAFHPTFNQQLREENEKEIEKRKKAGELPQWAVQEKERKKKPFLERFSLAANSPLFGNYYRTGNFGANSEEPKLRTFQRTGR